MFFTKETTTTIPPKDGDELDPDKIRLRTTETHVIFSLPFTHGNTENTEVHITDEPFRIEVSAFDNAQYYTMKVTLDLNKEITSLSGVFFSFDDENLHVHFPSGNLKPRKRPERALIPYKPSNKEQANK